MALALANCLVNLHGTCRATERVRVEPLDFGRRISVEYALKPGFRAQIDRFRLGRVEQEGRIEDVELDFGGRRYAQRILGQTLEDVLIVFAPDAFEIELAALLVRHDCLLVAAQCCWRPASASDRLRSCAHWKKIGRD